MAAEEGQWECLCLTSGGSERYIEPQNQAAPGSQGQAGRRETPSTKGKLLAAGEGCAVGQGAPDSLALASTTVTGAMPIFPVHRAPHDPVSAFQFWGSFSLPQRKEKYFLGFSV